MINVGIVFESTAASYIEDGLLRGLTQLLGSDRVAAWPSKLHHDNAAAFPYAPEATCATPFSPPTLLFPSDVEGLDLLVVGNPSNNSEHLGQVYGFVEAAHTHGVPVVGLDGGDVPRMEQLTMLLPGSKLFVRESQVLRGEYPQVLPITFAAECDGAYRGALPWSERGIDVLWAGSTNYAGRAAFTDALKAWSTDLRVEVVESRSLPYASWCERLEHAKVCIDLRGAGAQTYRYFEGAAAGCAVLSQGPVRFCGDLPLHIDTFVTPEDMLAQITKVLDFTSRSRILRDVTLRQLRARTRYNFQAHAEDFLSRALGA